jgi:multiple sugar transport system ATP-binding protein
MASPVRLCGLTRHFPGAARPALAGLDLDVAAGEVVALVGPSGCGKSTTLRLVAGLDRPDAGSIEIGVRDVSHVPPQARDVAMVFQGFALYPHLRVRDILAFPLKMRRVVRAERAQRVAETARLLDIERLLDRRPGQLSGGEQQRVAMGRAIIRRPEVFLFDEPLSNLDAALRATLRVELGRLLARLEATALYVTHDQAEAMTLGHRIAVLREGRLEQLDTPRRIYEQPATTFVASFFGTPPMNLVPTQREGSDVCAEDLRLPAPAEAPARLVLGLRPEHLHVLPATTASGVGPTFAARIRAVEPHGADTHVEVEAVGTTLRARMAGFAALAVGDTVRVAVDATRVCWFDAETGTRL